MSRCRSERGLARVTGYKLLVCDVDGTLVDKRKQLTPATVDAVERLEAAGMRFTIISARPRSGMMPIAETLGIDGPIAAFNGGLVFHRDGAVDSHDVVDPEVARGVFELLAGLTLDIWVFADDRWHAPPDGGEHV